MGRGSVGQMGHNFGWITWVMGYSTLTHDPLPFTACLQWWGERAYRFALLVIVHVHGFGFDLSDMYAK